MALFENAIEGIVEGGAATGVAIGVGVLLLAPWLLPAIGRTIRPLVVGTIKMLTAAATHSRPDYGADRKVTM